LRGLADSALKSAIQGGALLAITLCVTSGCSSSSNVDEATASGGEVTLDVPVATAAPEVFLVVMDDTTDAADLQDRVATEFEQYDATVAAGACHARLDQASFVPVDRSLVVVHPSAADGARYDSPATIPALRWQADNQTEDGRLAWTAAVRQALTTVTTPSGQFQALDAIQRSVSLLSGSRAASTTEEQALLAALPATPQLPVVIALDHEDAGTLDPASYAVPPAIPWQSLIVPGGSSCSAPPRLGAWAQAESSAGVPPPQLWGCGDVSVLSYPQADCSSPIPIGSPIAFGDAGNALCEALIRIDPNSECTTDRGWADPLNDSGVRAPLIDSSSATKARVCEVLQLTGAALSACQNDLSCAACTPGWCLTEIAALTTGATLHDDNEQSLAPRFVLGSNLPDGASELTLTCETLE
jgi:hypothetical protein